MEAIKATLQPSLLTQLWNLQFALQSAQKSVSKLQEEWCCVKGDILEGTLWFKYHQMITRSEGALMEKDLRNLLEEKESIEGALLDWDRIIRRKEAKLTALMSS
jgi:hypothetical protein